MIWKSEWGCEIYFTHGTSNARGVAILLPRDSDLKVLSSTPGPDGRSLVLQIEHNGVKYTLINVYAPTADEPEKELAFIDGIEECIQDVNPINIFMGGDLNHCINPTLDKFNRRKTKIPSEYNHGKVVGKRLDSLMEELQLTDAWRHANPTTRQYTFRRRSYASRLDYWLISDHLKECLHKPEISQVALSDTPWSLFL